jgi:hypothetical protein
MIKEVLEVCVDAEIIEKLIKEYVVKATYTPTGNLHFDCGGNAWVEVENEIGYTLTKGETNE